MERPGIPAVAKLVSLLFCLTTLPISVSGQDETTPPDRDILIKVAREVANSSTTCALVTIDADGRPSARMMDPFPPEPDMTVWLATNSESRKVAEIRSNPRVALYYADADGPGYLTIKGTARLVDDPKEKEQRWKESWEEFYGEKRANYLLIEVSPETLEVVSYRHGIVSIDPETWKVPTIVFEH